MVQFSKLKMNKCSIDFWLVLISFKLKKNINFLPSEYIQSFIYSVLEATVQLVFFIMCCLQTVAYKTEWVYSYNQLQTLNSTIGLLSSGIHSYMPHLISRLKDRMISSGAFLCIRKNRKYTLMISSWAFLCTRKYTI